MDDIIFSLNVILVKFKCYRDMEDMNNLRKYCLTKNMLNRINLLSNSSSLLES